MGITQCNSLSEGKLTFELIAKVLPKGETQFEKQIVNEYIKIKHLMYKKLSENKEPYYISSKEKCLCDYVDIGKRKELFAKWAEILIDTLKQSDPSNLTQFIEEYLMFYKLKDSQRFIDMVCLSPPKSLRWTSWLTIADIPIIREKKTYEAYLKNPIAKCTEDQIKKDLNRTLFIDNNNENEKQSLYNILRAFSNLDQEVSYCQGMNFITAFLLQSSSFDEVNTFHLLSFVFIEIRGFYSDQFPELKSYLYVFNHYFKKYFPKLSKHFESLEIVDELWIGKWIQTLFTICLPFDITQRFWDHLLSYGFEFIIPLSLGILYQMEKRLLELKDSSDVIEYFKEAFAPKERVLLEKDIVSNVIAIDKILVYALQLYKTITKTAINGLKIEFEKKNNINLDVIKKRYTMMNIKPMTTLSSASSDFSYRINDDNNKSFLPSSIVVNKSLTLQDIITNTNNSNCNSLVILNDNNDDCYLDEISNCNEDEMWFETNRSKMATHVMSANMMNKRK